MYRYCPNCREEYVASVTHCHECGIPLVDELPPEPEPPESDYDEFELVQVWSGDRFKAQMVRSFLEGHDIPATVAGEGYSSAYPVSVGSIGEGRVLVRFDDAEEARGLILETVEPPPSVLSADDPEQPTRRLVFDQPRWLLAGIAAVLLVLWLLFDPRLM